MNAKQKWILGAAALVLLLVIAGFGYQELKKAASAQNMASLGTESGDEQDAGAKSEENQKDESQSSQPDSSEESGQQQGETEEKQEEKTQYQQAPDFTVWNQAGEQVSLREILEGKPAVVNFWTSKCPPCKEEMPDFQEVYEKLGDKLQFIMVDGVGCMGETEESGKAYVEEQAFSFPVYYDLEMSAVITYGIQAFPTTYLINEKGELVAGGSGMLSKENLLAILEEYLGVTGA